MVPGWRGSSQPSRLADPGERLRLAAVAAGVQSDDQPVPDRDDVDRSSRPACQCRYWSTPGVRITSITFSPAAMTCSSSACNPRSACQRSAFSSSPRPRQVCGCGSSRPGSRSVRVQVRVHEVHHPHNVTPVVGEERLGRPIHSFWLHIPVSPTTVASEPGHPECSPRRCPGCRLAVHCGFSPAYARRGARTRSSAVRLTSEMTLSCHTPATAPLPVADNRVRHDAPGRPVNGSGAYQPILHGPDRADQGRMAAHSGLACVLPQTAPVTQRHTVE